MVEGGVAAAIAADVGVGVEPEVGVEPLRPLGVLAAPADQGAGQSVGAVVRLPALETLGAEPPPARAVLGTSPDADDPFPLTPTSIPHPSEQSTQHDCTHRSGSSTVRS